MAEQVPPAGADLAHDEAAQPTQSAEPVEPVESAEPVKPMEPVEPDQSAQTAQVQLAPRPSVQTPEATINEVPQVVASLEPNTQSSRGTLNAATDPSLAPLDQSSAPIAEVNDHSSAFHASTARSGELAQSSPLAFGTAHQSRPNASQVDIALHDPPHFAREGRNNPNVIARELSDNPNEAIITDSLSAHRGESASDYTQHYTLSRLNGFEIGAVPLRFTGDDRSSIHLRTFLSLFRSIMNPQIFEKLSAAQVADQYVSFTTLRDAGFSVSYDPKRELLILEVQ
jgi:hypothetical protein